MACATSRAGRTAGTTAAVAASVATAAGPATAAAAESAGVAPGRRCTWPASGRTVSTGAAADGNAGWGVTTLRATTSGDGPAGAAPALTGSGRSPTSGSVAVRGAGAIGMATGAVD